MPNQTDECPLDRAFTVSRCLAALDALLAHNSHLEVVKGDDLATLMHLLNTELTDALQTIEHRQTRKPHLRGV